MISEKSQEFYNNAIAGRVILPDLDKRDYKTMTKMNSDSINAVSDFAGITFKQESVNGVPVEIAIVDENSDEYIYYIHGGGFVLGEPAWGHYCALQIAKKCKRNVVSVDYSLAPKYKFPQGINDCGIAYAWMLEKGIPASKIVFLGESAGGNLVLAMGHWCKEHNMEMPAGICAVSPVVDLRFPFVSYLERKDRECILSYNQNEEVWKTYLTQEQLTDPLASPICGDCTGFPKVYIQVSSEEMLYDDSIEMCEKLRADGVSCEVREWEGMWHTFYMMDFPESEIAHKEIAAFFDSCR